MLAGALGYVSRGPLNGRGWAAASGIASAAFFATCFLGDVQQWGRLIPAGLLSLATLFMLVPVLAEIVVPHQAYPALPNTSSFDALIWVLFLGLAATFGAV